MASHPEFGELTSATEVANVFNEGIKGKKVLLVGVSPNSLGEHMAAAIASHSPALLILASRTVSKIEEVITTIKTRFPATDTNTIKVISIDLSSQSSIRTAAKEIAALTDKLDIVINNAAVNVLDYQETKEGIEMHFGTNHVGLFLLTNLLLPKVLVAAKGAKKGETRIVNLTSAGHRLSPIRFSDWNFKKVATELPESERPPEGLPEALIGKGKSYSTYVAYGQSKTANILFSVSLNAALVEHGVRSWAVHPGSIWTGLARNLDEAGKNMIKLTGKVWKTGDQGASTAIVAAFDPALSESNEVYMADCQIAQAAHSATDKEIADRLWTLSEELVGEKFNLAAL